MIRLRSVFIAGSFLLGGIFITHYVNYSRVKVNIANLDVSEKVEREGGYL